MHTSMRLLHNGIHVIHGFNLANHINLFQYCSGRYHIGGFSPLRVFYIADRWLRYYSATDMDIRQRRKRLEYADLVPLLPKEG